MSVCLLQVQHMPFAMKQRWPAQQHCSSKAAMLLLVCLMAVVCCTSAAAQQTPNTAPAPGAALPDPAQSSKDIPDGSDDTSSPPKFFWPAPIAKRCWAPGTTPQLSMTVLGILDAKEESEAYIKDPNLLFDGYW
jgi:hypothetical protein